ncbi:Cupin 2, conserved barrel domain protein [Candidatus Sulfopaludibacter sp. SbA6]|nr:Cupin 2, conserved barrel domain protein [Candidatus Sulfopaludibacter sp. SbA6]
MQRLGYTRSSYQPDHLLLTPDTFVRAPRPGMENATAIVHVSPAVGAGFTQYTAEFEAAGRLGPASGQRFVYVLEGDVSVDGRPLGADGYAYLPEECDASVTGGAGARVSVIEKPYRALDGVAQPAMLIAAECAVAPKPLLDDADLQVRVLLPGHPGFDFAVNTMTFQPGASLPMVEIHMMEHGLVMLAGGGIYRLGEKWYPVTAGDFIWMAPYCPQWFGALGKTPAKYLIYKDWNR